MIKSTVKLIVWLIILLIGLFAISNLTSHSGLAGSGAGTGVFSHSFRAQIYFIHDLSNHDSTIVTISIKAKHPAKFMLSGHVSPNYRSAKIEWLSYRDHPIKGEAIIDLENMQIVGEGNATRLNPETISRLLGIVDATDQDKLMADALIELLQAARDGNLPRPSHHGYPMSEPLPGRMHHGATGFSLRPMELAWAVGWSAYGMMMLFRTRSRSRASHAKHGDNTQS